ncbi:protein FAR1-RELATED SEQUENCE 11 [Artemisia annua]|uniref:Protein FAR1-RELATED SEQUENCE n=1 Tax=Artemisia annua TaxID=35608 RepID=A0A2U1N9W0_ARTAN|nr:protein FAR1-RELATED SEQUENCE 11 [Artemisia annua]
MELEKDVRHGELPFLVKDVHNFFTKLHKARSPNDARELLEYCKSAKSDNPNFQFAYTLDDENRLEHIFWSQAHCFNWYQKYGDVIVFDTAYKVNSYEMSFVVFVGIDNHGRTILPNFSLLMKKSPGTILTVQDLWMTEAIAKEMPFTKDAFCIWHITTKFSGWFTSVLRIEYSSWCSEFYNLYKLDTIEEFEQQWPLVI